MKDKIDWRFGMPKLWDSGTPRSLALPGEMQPPWFRQCEEILGHINPRDT